MVRVSEFDKVFNDAQRQGRISFYLTSRGEEACSVASAAALSDTDFILPQYRELGAAFWRGFTFEDTANQLCSNSLDPAKGRQLPLHIGDRSKRFFYVKSTLGTQWPARVNTCAAPCAAPCAAAVPCVPAAQGRSRTIRAVRPRHVRLGQTYRAYRRHCDSVALQVPACCGRCAGTQAHGKSQRGTHLLWRGLRVRGRHPVCAQHRRGAQDAHHLLLPQQRLRNQHAGAQGSDWGGWVGGKWGCIGYMGG